MGGAPKAGVADQADASLNPGDTNFANFADFANLVKLEAHRAEPRNGASGQPDDEKSRRRPWRSQKL